VLAASARNEALVLLRSPFVFVVVLLQPIVFTSIALAGVRGPASASASQTLLGVGLLAMWASTVWTAGLLMRREQWQGSLVTLAYQPADLRLVVLGKCAGAVAVSFVFVVVAVAGTAVLLRIPVSVARPGPYALVIAATLCSVVVLGFAFSCVFVMSRAAVRIIEAILYPVFILGGLLLPLEMLPAFAQVVAYGLSLYWGGSLARAAAAGAATDPLAWAMLAATTATYAAVALAAFRTVMRRARELGTLDFH
jgi:ABC-2 type transport system permease protein